MGPCRGAQSVESAQCRVSRVKRPRPRPERIASAMEQTASMAPAERTTHAEDCWTLSDARDSVLRPRAPWRWVAPRTWPATEHACGPDFTHALNKPPRVAIGCGRQAALATRLLRVRGARVVQILDPRLPPESWDVVVAPEHDG